MKRSDVGQLKIDPDERELLLWKIPNQVIYGFKVDCFQERVGASENEFNSLTKHLRSMSDSEAVALDPHEMRVFRNALALTMFEFGVEEFATQTGSAFEQGHRILRELNSLLEIGEID